MAFGRTDCPAKDVTVKVTNEGAASQGYSITRNGELVLADRLGANASRTSEVTLAEDKTVIVRVTQDGETVKSRSYKLNCVKGAATPTARPERLPETGSDTGTLIARLATGAASIVTGAIILWWGGLWPRRREGMFGSADRG
ncbi:hypothetical protein LO762_19555 [Actinocorallia sp. API 0066]|uniref:hypothetical protein n=1 Tax=Actinocorallia sp. API 0066 TaxID=2896846 RepID=UPI001E3F120D|nr:hypothetical protein [Actinocorallia sp. API 0066]MCD0451379.1 hypothetical protein [Actinocorallia sp. API 0066]